MGRKLSIVLAILVATGGLVATILPILLAANDGRGYHPVDAMFLALGVMLLLTAVLLLPIRKVRIAARYLQWTDIANNKHDVRAGWLVPSSAVEKLTDPGADHPDRVLSAQDANAAAPELGVSALRALYRGKDNRASTSKSVALAWTYAIVFGLVALLALKLMGDETAWTKLTGKDSLQEEYLLLLGGPFAAALIAKYAAVAGAAADSKTSAPEGSASPATDLKNLVADDNGDTDLGDLQYVLFNLVALAFFLGTLIADPREAFPDLPSLLVGLALTSAATYTAKQAAVSAAGPQLTSIFPTSAKADDPIDLFGRNLVSDGEAPKISVESEVARKVDIVQTAGSGDHLTFKVPAVEPGKNKKVRVTNVTTGATAQGPGGSDYIPIEIV
jgi:hypothetical protein